jgi:glycosyltransferase involved in cell wall biosynthesis
MTIVWINKRNWQHPGPIVNMSVHNAHSFASIGLSSHLVLGAGTGGTSTDDDLRSFYALEPLPNFTVHRVPRKGGLLSSESSSVFRAGIQLVRELAKQGPVAVFTREVGLLARLAWMCRGPNVRAFYELHDFFADLSWRGKKHPLKDWRTCWIEKLFLPRISGLICITREMERLYQQVFPHQSTIALPLGTDTLPPVDAEVRRKARTIFYVGHMHGPKGVSFLQSAAIKLAQHGVRTEFWGGYEKDAVRIRKAAEEKGLGQWIEAVPFQPPAALQAAMAARASLGVVMLADTYYNRYLTCPVKALDYLSHGVPALGTDIESVQEVLGHAGTYLPEGDEEAFVTAALHLLDDSVAYANAVMRTRARAAQITWQERAKALTEYARTRF